MRIYLVLLIVLITLVLMGQDFYTGDPPMITPSAARGTVDRQIKTAPKDNRLIRIDKDLTIKHVDPPLNSVRAAHGNTDWHIDTANEFLFGTDMNGNATATNHCPDTWTKKHIHTGLTNTNHFYYDNDVTTPGDDCDTDNGMDRTMLFFYAGHGIGNHSELFSALGSNASVYNMRLGDYSSDDKGILRYYWQCSCQNFAHGPKDCGATSSESYGCPEKFDGSADSVDMRNVYERWGPVLDPCLRMACGVSTSAYCHEGNVNKIWDNYNNNGFDVADSFIDGLHGVEWVVPLCITKGNLSTSNTTLVQDDVFSNECNPFSGPYYHIQFLSNFATTAPQFKHVPIPELIPIWRWEPEPQPDPWKKFEFAEKDNVLFSKDEIKGRGPKYRYNKSTGAVYALGERIFTEDTKVLDEKVYIEKAKDIVKNLGWDESLKLEPVGRRMMIARIPEEGRIKDASDIYTVQKNVIVSFKRQIDVDGTPIKVLGEGGAIRIQMNNDGSLQNASKVWRRMAGTKTMARVKKYEQAYDEALKELGQSAKMYELKDWDWGYKEPSGNDLQRDMTVVFRFNFMPSEPDWQTDYPPRIVEVNGIAK